MQITYPFFRYKLEIFNCKQKTSFKSLNKQNTVKQIYKTKVKTSLKHALTVVETEGLSVRSEIAQRSEDRIKTQHV